MCSSFGVSCPKLSASWTWFAICFPMLGKFSSVISSYIFSGPFCFFSFQDFYNTKVDAFNVVPEVSLAVLIFFFFSILFYILCSGAVVSTILFSRSLIRLCASVILLLIPSSILFSLFVCSLVLLGLW